MRPVARIAQSVEQGIENPRVLGSIPSSGTTLSKASQKCGAFSFLQQQPSSSPGRLPLFTPLMAATGVTPLSGLSAGGYWRLSRMLACILTDENNVYLCQYPAIFVVSRGLIPSQRPVLLQKIQVKKTFLPERKQAYDPL